ncbi:DDE-type integrase/transposase/recombinase [Nitrosopumilus sp.]|uniref:DDE-type integrase/transposase/recombinase n=1 Tax=Nitrosopumilus sp. TaxID=2024843 RepID=UPI0026303417|nr:DDE-type integrase/transposase/recombinase [Nitrosopumilus sp.]
MDKTDPRQEKGKEIANSSNQIQRVDENHYRVKSQTSEKEYDVIATEKGWTCTCPDHCFRQVCCKHIHAVEFSKLVRTKVWKATHINEIETDKCKFCESSKIIKKGLRKNKTYSLQVYQCKDCDRKFSVNLGFEKMKASPQVITSAMQLYFSGESLRNVQRFLELQGVKITHKTVWNWINKYVGLMNGYLDEIVPNVSDKWRADELYLKVKGNTKYLYAMMDDDTRFWIAKQVSDRKYKDDIVPMFEDGKKLANKKPKVLITDGAQNFHLAYKRAFFSKTNPKTIHIRHIHLKNDMNNNKMERLNGEIRDREKVMRGLKKDDSPIIDGYRIYHNFIRGHMAFDRKTPADIASIKVHGDNKWITLIQNASKRS